MSSPRTIARAAALVAFVAVLVAAAPALAVPSLSRLPPLHAEVDRDAGNGRIVDSRGREVLLRGVNVNAHAEYWKGTRFPTVFPLAAGDPERMAGIGWNVVRLLVSWSRMEPEPGRYDERYLEAVARTAERLERFGLYTIVDFHQDAWGPSLAARPGEVCAPPQQPALGWDGAPAWATLDGGLPRCYTGAREANPAVYAAWQSFLADAEGPGEVGIQTRYVAMLRFVARRFARATSIAGFDLINEPNSYGPLDDQRLSQLYARALESIRAGERAGGGGRHLVLFEPSVLWSADVRLPPPDFAHDRDVVFAPHVYTGGFNNGPITREAFEDARQAARGYGGVPVLSGEWGSDPDRAREGGDHYFARHQELQDDFRFSATLWTWRESCGDPHKVADYRAGRIPEVWGEFEVDCRSNEVLGVRSALVRELTRAHARAAPGRLEETRYEDASGHFRAAGQGPRGAGELVVFYPLGKHAGARGRTTGLRALRVARAPAGGRLIMARPLGGPWSITVGRSVRGHRLEPRRPGRRIRRDRRRPAFTG